LRDRSIIHLNIADFAVAVERVMDPVLRGRPVIIVPEGARAVVYDMSEEAYGAGVRKGMGLKQAVRFCKDTVVLPPRPNRYERAMQGLLSQALPYSPLVEPGSGDGHLFVDVTGTSRLFGPSVDVAWRLRKQIQKDMGLIPIWSVAANKLVAKVATRLVKPLGEYVVKRGEEEKFLAMLPVCLLPGIEKRDLARLRGLNLMCAWQVAALSREQLAVPFGMGAPFIYETVRGIDPSPVLPVGKGPPRLVAEHEFGNDTNDVPALEAILYRLVEKVGRGLRKQRRFARRLSLTVDYSDGLRCVRQGKVQPATANDLNLFDASRRVFQTALARRVRVRHIRLVCDRLIFPPAQVLLWTEEREKEEKKERVVAAVDHIRDRYGADAIKFGRTLAA
jgi:DNA polymerase-4